MTIQQIVNPENVEIELQKIWEKLAQENKMRACLFNLLVFNRYSERADYIRNIAQKIIEKFPCRVLFISENPDAKEPYLKTAVSVMKAKGESSIACDDIDFGVSSSELHKIPYVLLPHIIPDLPIVLLWAEDPSKEHILFESLTKIAHRIIFDSESADSLSKFANTVLNLVESKGYEIADLNWGRTEGWRDLISNIFNPPERLSILKEISEITITFNAKESESFCHVKIQSMYLLFWLADRLQWKFQKTSNDFNFEFENGIKGSIIGTKWEKTGPGTILSVVFKTKSGQTIDCARIPERYHHAKIQFSSHEICDLPFQFVLGKTATGQSLVKEICMKGTSSHFIEMLQILKSLKKDLIC